MNSNVEKKKKCVYCNKSKLETDFYKTSGDKCKECAKLQQRARNKKAKELETKTKTDPELKNKPKTCRRCQKIKTVGDFRINRGECLECERSFGRKYNKDHHEIRQKWQDENREHFDELRARRYQRKKPEIRAKYRERYSEDICFRIHRLLKRRMQRCIQKIKSTEDYIGTKFERVAEWLEYNFTDDMTWENHGTVWDIDHVIPVCKWNLKDEKHIDMCFNWKNLSPMSSPVNRNTKREKIDKDQVEHHLRNLQKYFIEKELDETELLEYLNQYGNIIQEKFLH